MQTLEMTHSLPAGYMRYPCGTHLVTSIWWPAYEALIRREGTHSFQLVNVGPSFLKFLNDKIH